VTQVRHEVRTPSAVCQPAAGGRPQVPRRVDGADRSGAVLVGRAGPMIRAFSGLTVPPLRASTPAPGAVELGGPVGSANGGNGAGPGHPGVTTEELAILTLLASGLTLDSVAVRVAVSQRTLSRRLRCVCDRLGVAHPIQAIVWAARRGLL
jgi:DNA-binding CsgD family transcriptional regulator